MIEKISLALVSETGETVFIERLSDAKVEIKIEETIADLFSKICFRNNSITDAEIKTAEKFHFAAHLQKYLKETQENAD